MSLFFKKETDLAKVIVQSLDADGWDVYQEVNGIDIVAKLGAIVWVIECKLQFGFKVLEQAWRHRYHAHAVWVATPRRGAMRVERHVCSYLGVGWVQVSAYSRAFVEVSPSFNRKASVTSLVKRLRPEHKTHLAAGSPCGGGWTPFKATCAELLRYVEANPGCTMKEAMDGIEHHYRTEKSARSTMPTLIRRGIVPGVRLEKQGRGLALYPVKQ